MTKQQYFEACLLNTVKNLYVAMLKFVFVYKHLIFLRSLMDLVPVRGV
jgi:hypothetical protein